MENDIAFKVIVKNDGISDIIFKTLMLKGEAGGTISSIEKTSSVGVVDTYTITLNDGTTTTFEVTNGSNIESIEKTATSGLIDTYTVTLTNGDTTTFEVKNGEDAQLYELPEDCIVAYDKEPELHSITGQNGYVAFDAYGVKNVKVTGYTKQATTTGKNLFDISQISSGSVTGVDYDVNTTTGTITISGEATGSGWKSILNFNLPEVGTYHFHLERTGNVGYFLEGFTSLGADATVVCNDITTTYRLAINAFTTGVDYEGTISQIQIEKGSTATSYEPYTGGKPSPNPDYPQDIIGYGTKELDGTYTIDIEVTDADDNVYNITASGLAYPLYDGDVLDFENSKVIRANDLITLNSSGISTAVKELNIWRITFTDRIYTVSGNYPNAYSNKYKVVNSYTNVNQTNNSLGVNNSSNAGNQLLIRDDTWTSGQDVKDSFDDLNLIIVYPLETPTEESVTISGDTSIVENLRGWTQVDAWDEEVTLDVWYYSDVDFPDGYEEVGLPIDDLLYYQDEEYIEFPQSWGFAIGYVFDASEIRFVINVTKKLHDGYTVEANRSLSLALDSYMGAGGGGTITGFNFVDASFIKEYGQIQIRLKTENPHGLPLGALLGARVNSGRLRITFHAPE